MTDESTTQTNPIRPLEPRTPSGGTSGSGNPSSTPAAGSTFADPARREIGDKPVETAKRTDLPKVDEKAAKVGDCNTSSGSPSV